LWSGAAGYTGKHVQVETGLPITPVNPRIPIWVGGSIRRSAARAARLGDGWYGGVTFRLSQLPRQTQAYRAALGGDTGAVAVNRVTLLAETPSAVDTLTQQYAAPALMSFAHPANHSSKSPRRSPWSAPQTR
jgi:alkanesulfonate monooxygenase SsuD/methylene tetrahydromethanopterin reductase-like flavin-dependent oxidoreductase (luciferase family)